MYSRLALRLAGMLALAGMGSGCLQPVHSTRFGSESVQSQLSEISVTQVEGYLGYALKTELDYLLTNGQPVKTGRYQLKVATKQNKGSSIIDATTGRAQLVTIQVEAIYELRETKGGKIRGSGRTFASATYDRSQQRFATIRAQRDAEERVGKALAERLKIILMGMLANQSGEATTAPDFTPLAGPQEEPQSREPGDEN